MKRKSDKDVILKQPVSKRRSLRKQKHDIIQWRSRSLCDACLQIQPDISDGNNNIVLSIRLSDVLDSVKADCEGCSFFAEEIVPLARAVIKERGELALTYKVRLNRTSYGSYELRIENTEYRRLLEACEISAMCVQRLTTTNEFSFRQDGERVDPSMWHSPGEVACTPRVISPEVLTEETRQLVSAWLSKCSKHDLCRPPKDQILPTRILDVQVPETPRLVETHGKKGQYVILSHCWGSGADMYKTTTGLLQKHMNGMEANALPPNFQHAIAITVLLGYRYLWIDSLCILQDDSGDWKAEAVKMGSYYLQSALMISASAAINSASGFLQPRKHSYSPPFGEERWFTLRRKLILERDIDTLPISKRAWTMQERFLAPRVLHFFPDQMLFECGSCFFSEGYYKNNATDYGHWFNKSSIQDILEPRLDLQESRKVWPDAPEWAPYMKESRTRRWYDLIANFSSRAITFPSDRLPALAGLARIFAHPSLGLYLAGLWADDLYTGLSWTTTFPDSTAMPHSYFAPSWSWLSANAACSWDGRLWASATRGPSRQQTEEHSHWKKNYGPKLLSTHIQSVFGDTFTSVKEGSYIELEGYCRSLLIRYKPPTKTAAGPNGVVLKTVHLDKPVSGDISFYFENTPESSREVILLQICKSGGHDLSVHALLLEGSKEAGYRRIGTARLENYNLCGFLTTKSYLGLQWVAHRHPREVDGRKSDMENREWQLDRWERRKIKIF